MLRAARLPSSLGMRIGSGGHVGVVGTQAQFEPAVLLTAGFKIAKDLFTLRG